MEICKTVKLKLTEEEAKAIRTLYNMLNEVDREEECILADELDYCDLTPIKNDLERLWELGGRDIILL